MDYRQPLLNAPKALLLHAKTATNALAGVAIRVHVATSTASLATLVVLFFFVCFSEKLGPTAVLTMAAAACDVAGCRLPVEDPTERARFLQVGLVTAVFAAAGAVVNLPAVGDMALAASAAGDVNSGAELMLTIYAVLMFTSFVVGMLLIMLSVSPAATDLVGGGESVVLVMKMLVWTAFSCNLKHSI